MGDWLAFNIDVNKIWPAAVCCNLFFGNRQGGYIHPVSVRAALFGSDDQRRVDDLATHREIAALRQLTVEIGEQRNQRRTKNLEVKDVTAGMKLNQWAV